MLFLDLWFWKFAAVAIPGLWLCPARLRIPWLLAASSVFHWYFAGPAGMAPIVLLAVWTYAAGRWRVRDRVAWFAASCVLLVGALAFYKYSEFAARSLAAAASAVGLATWSVSLSAWQSPAAPLAISFFTFEFVHYLYEIRTRGREPIKNPVHFALFAIFFPTLASGPIKRFPDFVPQLDWLARPTLAEVRAGAERVVRGLFKKICIADMLVPAIGVLESSPRFTPEVVALLAIAQGFRIYYDFDGYSDMAIGLSRMVGLRVPENFDRPYFSTSLQAFWRRWHMSLSSWIRDYVYIPLGGNRGRRHIHLISAMGLCGLWHGADWNFVIWGLYHGVGLAAEAAVRGRLPRFFEAGGAAAALRWGICYGFVTFGWLLFFYPMERVIQMCAEALG
jgi:alginate O-acetyltransferase complex protein AlgI